jgi:hypothetical protein
MLFKPKTLKKRSRSCAKPLSYHNQIIIVRRRREKTLVSQAVTS